MTRVSIRARSGIGRILVAVAVTAIVAEACSQSGATGAPMTLRLGYLGNLTHAPAMVGLESGLFAQSLGNNVSIDPKVFNAGPDAVEAILSGSLDAAFVGPNPAINAYVRSKGEAIRIIAGATSGGASLVVDQSIQSPDQLAGKTLSSPELGNTQDVALRTWLVAQGFHPDQLGGGDVKVLPQANAQILSTFQAGQINGAWVPEPWASRLVLEGHGHVLVDEASLWPDGKFATTVLMVSTSFMRSHPDTVTALLKGLFATTDLITADPTKAQGMVQSSLTKLSGKPLAANVLASAWSKLTFTNDPAAGSFTTLAQHAEALNLLPAGTDLAGIFDLGPLNAALKAAGRPAVTSADD